jgi:hypothetical protein
VKKGSPLKIGERLVDSIIVPLLTAIYICNQNILKSLMQLLDCRELDPGTSYLYTNMTENCNSDDYKAWLYFLIIPFFFFYALIVPSISYIFMFTRRKTLFDIRNMKKIGFLVIGLNQKNYLW